MEKRRIAVVTGGTRGIGLAITKALLSDNYAVTAVARTEDRKVSAIGAQPAVGDIRDSTFRRALHQRFQASGIDVLMNNAGIYFDGRLSDASDESVQALIDTNLVAHIALTRELLPLVPQRSGTIGFLGSKAGIEGRSDETVYSASKFGLRGFYESLRRIPFDIRPRIVVLEPTEVNTWAAPEPNTHIKPSDVASIFAFSVNSVTSADYMRIELRSGER